MFVRKMIKISNVCCGDGKGCIKVMPSPLKVFVLNLHNIGMVGYM
jgi:hypothetical protein